MKKIRIAGKLAEKGESLNPPTNNTNLGETVEAQSIQTADQDKLSPRQKKQLADSEAEELDEEAP